MMRRKTWSLEITIEEAMISNCKAREWAHPVDNRKNLRKE